jgi:hypothetical protein
MPQLQEEFLEAVMKDCLLAAPQVRKLIFQLRFNPENKDLKHKEIAALAKKQLAEAGTIYENNELKEIIRALVDTFEAQMIKDEDEVDVEFLKDTNPGKKGKWQLVYDWLWDKYYPRWSLEQQWQELVDKADKTDDWLQVTPVTRDVRLPAIYQPTIQRNSHICLLVKWNGENRYLLLLNQGTSGKKLCFCPSQHFAPSGELSQQGMSLPPTGAKAKSILFEDVGKEHFLGIVMEKPLDLAWLRPNDQEPVPALDVGRLNELLEKLEQQGNWQLFYKSFEVV